MREAIQKIALECWNGFELTGYSRIDIRVDENNTPFVLEINANPCLSKDAGFFAACEKAGLRYEDMVRRIIYDAYR
jgi:D-alanine-D-alanine ligase